MKNAVSVSIVDLLAAAIAAARRETKMVGGTEEESVQKAQQIFSQIYVSICNDGGRLETDLALLMDELEVAKSKVTPDTSAYYAIHALIKYLAALSAENQEVAQIELERAKSNALMALPGIGYPIQ